MSNYYCPYCPRDQQINQQLSNSVMICGNCGDRLVKDNLIKLKQFLALIVAAAFIAPLVLMVISFMKNTNKPASRPQLKAIAELTTPKRVLLNITIK